MPNAESSIWIELLKLSQEAPLEKTLLVFVMVFLLVGLATGNGKRVFDAIWNLFSTPKILFVKTYAYYTNKKAKSEKPTNNQKIKFSEIEIPNQQKLHMYRLPEIFIITDPEVKETIGTVTYKLSQMAMNDTKRTFMVLDFTDCKEINDNANLLVREIVDILTFTVTVKLMLVFDKKINSDDEEELKKHQKMKTYMSELTALREQQKKDFGQEPTWETETTEINFWDLI